jgi:hypothetical protein
MFKVLKPASAVMVTTIEKESAAVTSPPFINVVPSEVVADRVMPILAASSSITSS